MRAFGKLGHDEGRHAGPDPGDGADVASTPDVEGTAPDELPARPSAEHRQPGRDVSRGSDSAQRGAR